MLLPLLVTILALGNGASPRPSGSDQGHGDAHGHEITTALCVPGGDHSEGRHAHACNGAIALLTELVPVDEARPLSGHRVRSRARYVSPALAPRDRPPDHLRG